jgi:ABC-type phosphate transport system permease subunit
MASVDLPNRALYTLAAADKQVRPPGPSGIGANGSGSGPRTAVGPCGPAARRGVRAGAWRHVLGLGRAVGETIAVTMVIGNNVLSISTSIFGQGATMPSVIANEFTEATEPFHLSSLFVVGAWLLVIALIVNVAGKLIIRRAGEAIG